jgi:hypothetical protein
MVCYGPRLGTIAIAGAGAYVLLHRAIGRILHIAGLVMQIVLITCAAAAAVALLTWIVRTVQRRRAAAGACTTCRFRCQLSLTQRPARASLGPEPVSPRLEPVPVQPEPVAPDPEPVPQHPRPVPLRPEPVLLRLERRCPVPSAGGPAPAAASGPGR